MNGFPNKYNEKNLFIYKYNKPKDYINDYKSKDHINHSVLIKI